MRPHPSILIYRHVRIQSNLKSYMSHTSYISNSGALCLHIWSTVHRTMEHWHDRCQLTCHRLVSSRNLNWAYDSNFLPILSHFRSRSNVVYLLIYVAFIYKIKKGSVFWHLIEASALLGGRILQVATRLIYNNECF